MRNLGIRELALLSLRGVLALGLIALVWALGAGLSQAEQDAPHSSAHTGNWDNTWSEASSEDVVSNDIALGCGGNSPGMANPAAVYCRELGYQYRIVGTDEGQSGICTFPGGSECDEWQFLQGKCGQSFSYCARQGYDSITKTDGKNPFSREYSVCVRDQETIGAVTELMGLSEEATRGSFPVEQGLITPEQEVSAVGAPPSFDWRNYDGGDWMTPVKNQGSCGSCWAFSAVGVVEAVYNIASNDPDLDLNLSEEYLVADCLSGNSCCGGWMSTAFSFIRDDGIPDESCLPYVDQSGCTCGGGTCDSNCTYSAYGICSDATCSDRCSDWQDRLLTIDSTGSVSPSQIKQSVVDTGPLSVAMGIGSYYGGAFDALEDGADDIYECTNPNGPGINHGVIIVGYNDAGGYWIVKNSWGTGWPYDWFNDGGYFKVGYGQCAIENYVSYADVAIADDSDGDGVGDSVDNCPSDYNPDQTDTDGDGTGDACDACPDDPDDDADNDGICAGSGYLPPKTGDNDICPDVSNPYQENADGDEWGDACDNCPDTATPWYVPAGDDDCDGFTTTVEAYLSTDSLDDCPDDPSDDAWPLDIDMNGDLSVTGDVFYYRGHIGATPGDPEWWQRLDLDMSGDISATGDVFMYRERIGESCP